MKTYNLFFLIACVFIVNNALTQEKKDYLDSKVIFKLNAQKCKSVQDKALKNVLETANIINIQQKFPNAEKPKTKTNKYGIELIDLSLIYELSTDSDIFKLISILEKSGLVEYAEPHYLPEFLFVPNDPLLEDQYHLEKIMAYEAWDVHTGNSDVVIGITDSGTDIDHPDLIFQIAYNHNDPIDGIDNDGDGYIDNFRGWDLGCNDNYPQVDENNHGVWVSGISSAQVNNEIGIAGVAYDCKYLPIKISDSAGILTMAYEGIVYAADQGCNVINCSWGSERRSAFGQDIVDYAIINKDAVVVAACGNTNTLTSFYPASYDRVVSVAGTTINDEKWTPENTGTSSGSSFGYQVDISAPGTGYRTTNNGGGYNTLFGGTSFSAPIVAGVAAVVRSYYPNLNALQTAERLKRTADNIDTIQYNLPYAGKMGAGRVNMYNALTQEFTPSFVFENLKIEDDRDNYYQNSSLVKVKGKIINYLSEANNAVVVISTDCEHIELITNEIILGNVQASQVIDLDDDCINFTINEDAEFNTIVVLKLEFYADNYQSFQYIEVPIKPAFKVLDENNISIGIAGNGRLGYADNYAKLGVGMRYKNFEGLIYDCGLVIANSSNNVFCAIRQETDFLCIEYPNYVEPPIYGDKHISAKFNESLDIFSLGIEVVQNAYAWNEEPYRDFVILNYDLINKSLEPIHDLYAGLFADFDLLVHRRNKARYDFNDKYIYAEHSGTQNLFAGFKLLSNQAENHYALEQVAGGDGLIDMTDGFNDSEKFYMLSNSRDEAITEEEGADIVLMISAGPFDINPSDTVKLSFAIMAAESKYTLNQTAQNAVIKYDEMNNESFVQTNSFSSFNIYPNPVSNKLFIELEVPNNTNVFMEIYDLSGHLILEQTLSDPKCEIDISSLNSGIYVLKLIADKYSTTQKLIILN